MRILSAERQNSLSFRDGLPVVLREGTDTSQAHLIAVVSEAKLFTAHDPHGDGLILGNGHRQALFRQHVWGGIPRPRIFIRALKSKVGLAPDHWSSEMRAFRFSVESFGHSNGY